MCLALNFSSDEDGDLTEALHQAGEGVCPVDVQTLVNLGFVVDEEERKSSVRHFEGVFE